MRQTRHKATKRSRPAKVAKPESDPYATKPLLWGKHCRGPGCDNYNEQRPSCLCKCSACKPPRHASSLNGREAEELRNGIETLIAEKGETVHELMEFDSAELAVKASELLDLLDRVDARDSLAYLERKDRRRRSRTSERAVRRSG